MSVTTRVYVSLGLILPVILLVAVMSDVGTSSRSHVEKKSQDEVYWSARIEALGEVVAYQEFRDSVRELPMSDQHTASHYFGGALFETGGLLSTCAQEGDGEASNVRGCFHEYVGRSIAANGLPNASTVLASCSESVRGGMDFVCRHGVGRGIVSSIGYEVGDLSQALFVCTKGTVDRFCLEGVFMEYYTRSMLEDARVREPMGNFFAPCGSLDGPARGNCIDRQPQWWYALLHRTENDNEESIFAEIGKLCGEWKMADARACAIGVGRLTISIREPSFDRSRELCDVTFPEGDARMFCRTGAAFRFARAAHDLSRDAKIVCRDLPQSEKEYCESYADGEPYVLIDQ